VLIIVITLDSLQGENVTMKCIKHTIGIYLIFSCYEINSLTDDLLTYIKTFLDFPTVAANFMLLICIQGVAE
jgi:hypothetical protein